MLPPSVAIDAVHPKNDESEPRLWFVKASASACMLLGLVVLVGWASNGGGFPRLSRFAMEVEANTALGIFLAGGALLLASREGHRPRTLAPAVALAAFMLGALTLVGYQSGWELHLDQMLFRDPTASKGSPPGRMSPSSALVLVLLGGAILALRFERLVHVSRILALVGAALGIAAFAGYHWNVGELLLTHSVPRIAPQTSIAFVLLALATYGLGNALWLRQMPSARSRIEKLVLGGFIPTALLIVAGGVITFAVATRFAETARLIAHTHEVRAELAGVYSTVADAELARRNELLTEDARYGQEFERWAAEARDDLRALYILLADNPEQLQRHAELTALTQERLQYLTEIGTVLIRQGSVAAREALGASETRRAAAQTRVLAQQMAEIQAGLLKSHLQTGATQRNVTLGVLGATSLALTLLLAVLFRAIRSEVSARGHAEDELHRLNSVLEERVRDRTAQLYFQRDFLRRVIDLNSDMIFARDAQGRFVLANESLVAAYGTSTQEIVGRGDSAFSPKAEEVARFLESDRRVLDSGRDEEIDEELFTHADGSQSWRSTLKRPMPSPDGQETVVLCISRDISKRKAAEDELRVMAASLERRVKERTEALQQANTALMEARQEADAASRAKSAFLANMSHEIRTPMNAIIGLTHLLVRDARDRTQRDRLDKVGAAAQHLLQVINDILDISKIEAGKLTLEDLEFSMETVVGRAVDLVANQARAKGLELIVDQDHLPERARGDCTRLSQILINLMMNAVKFTESGWVRVRGAVIDEDHARVHVRFEVQDTGPGIARDRQAVLFSAFEQADGSSSRRYGGTGLGLALSRELALAMGGNAGVDSSPGAGSTFWFTAWLGRAAAATRPRSPTKLQGLRALLVDDLSEALAVIGEQLQNLGLEVDAANSCVDAIRRVEQRTERGQTYDVFLIDWLMEPCDGVETLRQLRDMLGDRTPASILVTASDDDNLQERASDARFDAVMLKPLTAASC